MIIAKFADYSTRTKVMIGVTAPLVLTVILAVKGSLLESKVQTYTDWVEHTHKVLAKASGIIASAVDMETGMRGYLLAGREELDPYRAGEAAVYASIDELQQTVSDNPGQVARLDEVRATLQSWQENVTNMACGGGDGTGIELSHVERSTTTGLPSNY